MNNDSILKIGVEKMGKLGSFKIIHHGGILIKDTFKYLLEHPSGVKKEEHYKKLLAKYDYNWYRNSEL